MAQELQGCGAAVYELGDGQKVSIRMYTLALLGIAVQYSLADGLTAMGEVRYVFPLSVFRKLVYSESSYCLRRSIFPPYSMWEVSPTPLVWHSACSYLSASSIQG